MVFRSFGRKVLLAAGVLSITAGSMAIAQKPHSAAAPKGLWMDTSLSPDRRADLVIKQMTLDEKIQLVHGTGWGVLREGDPVPANSNFGAGFTAGIPRLGIPDMNEADSAVGIRMAALQSRYATLLPTTLGAAASSDPDGAL
jgi:beta-glucosidase